MPSATAPTQERRRFLRIEGAPRLAINLVNTEGAVTASSINVSEAGLCLRIEEELFVRSLIQLELKPDGARQAKRVRCVGRVAWVVQRLDLRERPPFLYDVGIEFVDPPALLRQMLAQRGLDLPGPKRSVGATRALSTAVVRGRAFSPRLERSASPQGRWHLIVSVDGVPCFSSHYASERAALTGWEQFKRQQGRRP